MEQIMKNTLIKLGTSVRKFRLSKGMSQEKLGSISGIDRTYISSLERGKRNPSFLVLLRIVKALEVELSDLFNEFEENIL
jgi:transcriptional regulator with XRE-family HTH domain